MSSFPATVPDAVSTLSQAVSTVATVANHSTVATVANHSTVATVANHSTIQQKLDEFLDSNTATVGGKSSDPFPIVDKLWDVFSGKGIRTVFLSVGTSGSAVADLDIAESVGCPLHIVPLGSAQGEQWAEVVQILKDRKRNDSASPFSAGVETKWVLPKNIRLQAALPWWTAGQIDLSGTFISTQSVDDLATSISTAMKLKDSMKRIDILKIDTTSLAPGLEIPVVQSILSAGYRPSVVLMKWGGMPDTDTSTALAAGHLQCCGYTLMSSLGNKFLYYYNDESLYDICSWEQRTLMNPIANELIKATSKRSLSRV